jgi:hypothetical protein
MSTPDSHIIDIRPETPEPKRVITHKTKNVIIEYQQN